VCSDHAIKPSPSPPCAGRCAFTSRFQRQPYGCGIHCPRASDGLLSPRLYLVGYVRWDARSNQDHLLVRQSFSTAFQLAAKRRQRIGGVGIQLRKDAIRTPTSLKCAEGNMSRSASASFCSVRRSRRPQTRLETSCTRTGRPRRHLRSNQTAGRRVKA